MLLSLALIFIISMIISGIFSKIHLPALLGMLITGIVLGPHALNLLDTNLLLISPDLRKIALIIILIRAGFNLDIDDLKKNGRAGILMCFVPATFEIIATCIFAPIFLGVSLVEAAIIGAVIAAVSPAVIVPRMINLINNKIGTNKKIPQLIMAGASVDDIFVMVLFTTFLGLENGKSLVGTDLLQIPFSIIFGVLVGYVLSLILNQFFSKFHFRDSSKVIILVSIAFVLVTIESFVKAPFGFSGLLAVMTTAIGLRQKRPEMSKRVSLKFSKLWVCAEMLLFALVGAGVNIKYAISAGLMAIILIFVVLIIRVLGVYISLIGTKLNSKEKLFCAFAYIPKATVQAAIGGIPLAMGLSCGDIVLTMAVIAIIITAPVGACLIDLFHKKLLR